MRRIIGCAALLALSTLLLPAPSHAQDQDGIFPFPWERMDLDNGLRAYLIRAGAPDQIAYVSMVRTGARDEVEEGRTGYAHFFEHMMFRGTDKYPNYDGVTESIGAARNAFTSNDMTVYYMVAASDYLEQIVDLESDRFQRLNYSEQGFRVEAGAILGEYQNNAYSSFSVLDRAIRETAWRRHTYRHQTIGFEADVRAMPQGYQYSLGFYQRYYRPDNVILVIAGDFDFEEAKGLIREYYSDWEPGYQAPAIPIEPEQTAPRVEAVSYQGRTLPMLSLNWKGPAWSATDRMAVATEVLGMVAFGSNSDLYRRLVIEEQRVQSLQGGFFLSRDPDLVGVTAMVTDPADVDGIRGEIMATVERFQNELVDAKLLQDTKSSMKYGFLMGLETAQNVAFSLIGTVINTGGIEPIDDYYAALDAVTAEDVREAARAFLVDAGLTQVTLTQAGGTQ
ncbi:MAG TPA: pitrilysin family protein [Longimicrobiales bacterium]|jgi:zinc protease